MSRYFARSASDKTDDWPFWFVADPHRGDLNVSGKIHALKEQTELTGGVFSTAWGCVKLAQWANPNGVKL